MTQRFPIDAIKDDFIASLEQHNTLILTAPPGAGKSTRLPLWLLSLPKFSSQKASHKIYLLQPRRVAAKNIACYLSEQIGEQVGNTIGYRLKNESKTSKNTRLEVITEGILTQIIQHDPELAQCGLVIFDEFHERSLQGDLAFALARDVQQALRDDLTLVIMSATLAVQSLSEKLPDAVMLASEGRSFPVEVEYLPAATSMRNAQTRMPAKQWREHALRVITQQATEHDGSILVFLPGVADIKYLCQQLEGKLPHNVLLNPLYGELSLAAQQKAIAPSSANTHKLVLATNIAETSLTIEGVTLVIDCGFEKTAVYDAKTLTNTLQQRSIAKASAIQRAGRAGRLSAGKCLRLYSKEDFGRRDENSKSEIQQADLLPFVIEAARWGVTTLSDLPLIELPNSVKEAQAWQELYALKIVNEHNQLTPHGEQVAVLACHPRFAHMMIMANVFEQKHHVKELLALAGLIAAVLEERDVFNREQAQLTCSLTQRLEALLTGKINGAITQRILKQANHLSQYVNRKSHINQRAVLPMNYAGVLIALAYPERIAKYRNKKGEQAGEYATTGGKGVSMRQEDALLGEPYIAAAQIHAFQARSGQQNIMVQLAAPISVEQLIEWNIVQPKTEVNTAYNAQADRIIGQKVIKVDALVIDEVASNETLTNELVTQLWTDELKKQGMGFLALKTQDKALLKRWHWLTLYNKTLDLPQVDEQNLLEQTHIWFAPYVGDIKNKKQLDKCDFSVMLLSLLSYQQQQILVNAAPEYFIGPTKRRCAIRYTDERSPIVSLPMQELYGLTETPCVGTDQVLGSQGNGTGNGIPLVLEILSPAKRPIQVTQDLVAFWQGSYKAVQKDMKSQYPKHYWPDDPANAVATRKTKRHIKE